MHSEKTTAAVCLCAAPTRKDAALIAARLIESGKAACVNILAPCRSHYRWEGKMCADEEYPLVIKTARARIDEVVAEIRALHPFEVPEIIALPIIGGDAAYLDWVAKQCAASA